MNKIDKQTVLFEIDAEVFKEGDVETVVMLDDHVVKNFRSLTDEELQESCKEFSGKALEVQLANHRMYKGVCVKTCIDYDYISIDSNVHEKYINNHKLQKKENFSLEKYNKEIESLAISCARISNACRVSFFIGIKVKIENGVRTHSWGGRYSLQANWLSS